MPKFTKPFKGLVKGDKYETDFFCGDKCPRCLEDDAFKRGAIEKPQKQVKKQNA